MSKIFGDQLRMLREDKQIPQRQLAAGLNIDTATYCKIEKGTRRAKKVQVEILSNLLETDLKLLYRLWAADKVYDILVDEDEATQILNVVAESIVQYKRNVTTL